jgi:hypothetical protein
MRSSLTDLVEHGAAEGRPDRQAVHTDLGWLEPSDECPLSHLGRGAVAPCHALVEPVKFRRLHLLINQELAKAMDAPICTMPGGREVTMSGGMC